MLPISHLQLCVLARRQYDELHASAASGSDLLCERSGSHLELVLELGQCSVSDQAIPVDGDPRHGENRVGCRIGMEIEERKWRDWYVRIA